MGLDDYRKNFNQKLDSFGEDAMKKIRAQREANAGTASSSDRIGVKDRLNMFKGDNPRWNSDIERRRPGSSAAAEDEEAAAAAAGAARRMPPHSGYMGSKGPPPPPPVRRATSTSSGGHHSHPIPAAAPPAASTRGAVPPPPPPRMANENGTAYPPPPYDPATGEGAPRPADDYYTSSQPEQQPAYGQHHEAATGSWPVHSEGYIEFSKFTPQDKEVFWDLLDQYFDQKQRGLR
ncbi:uncharacterized protein PSFLO_03607 [Pseudozyma flocculosa]|uniref:Uncharacterized protein n=1 Tax=Pseudozyma flocculosa TaxID=84751 RepID=A0A5C3F239_9BASI|nr:uncharacterized protein PSFLO_03607 [Pseudozyma flocculosa]